VSGLEFLSFLAFTTTTNGQTGFLQTVGKVLFLGIPVFGRRQGLHDHASNQPQNLALPNSRISTGKLAWSSNWAGGARAAARFALYT
jgi:hypothetical protein